MNNIEEIFSQTGGQFILPFEEFETKLRKIKAFVFDWDGVFNAGIKLGNQGSPFAEPDSMGTNLMRLGYWLSHEEQFPTVGIITGANNPPAMELAARERFQAVYMSVKYKILALEHFCQQYGLKPEEIAYTFDDVNDLGMAQKVGIRFLVKRNASPMMTHYAIAHDRCDYITAHSGGEYAVREISELILSTLGLFDKVVAHRVSYDETYQRYLSLRNSGKPKHYKMAKHAIVELGGDKIGYT